jgi:hypothetical protein
MNNGHLLMPVSGMFAGTTSYRHSTSGKRIMKSISTESVSTAPPLRTAMRQFVRLLVLSLIWLLPTPVFADTFLVDASSDGVQSPANTTTCAEQGNTAHCSLRAAIMLGNTRAGSHTITFSPSVLMITVINGGLPTMMAQFTVVGNHITTINGNGHGCLDLTDSGTVALGHSDGATNSSITDMVINNCGGSGINANGHSYIFIGNFIGVDATGLIAKPNVLHGIALSSSHVYPDTSSNFLLNLYNNPNFPVQPIDASQINAFSNNLATALASLTPVVISGNVISGNTKNGIEIYSQNMAAVLISGNKIGTDLTGNIAIANGGDGVHLIGSTFGNLIGPDNVISGNTGNGIFVEAGTVFMPSYIMGNRIGLAATDASAHIGNGLSGIRTNTLPDSSVSNHNPTGLALLIGPSNLISDNKGISNSMLPDTLGDDEAGVRITGTSKSVKVVSNTIGMAEFPIGTPLASKAYGNVGDGIIVTSSGNTIGGSTSTGNIIAGNARHGIVVGGSGVTATNIQGNLIGVHSAFAGNVALGNGVDGVHVDSANSTNVGGAAPTDFNTIAGNGRNGLKIRLGSNSFGWSNLAQRNRIYSNAKLLAGVGLDLDHNENATDTLHDELVNYANLDQVAPVICDGTVGEPAECGGFSAPVSSGGNTTLSWTFKSHGPAIFRLEFFQIDATSDNAATSMTFLGEQQITTIASGLPSGAGCSAGRCTATIAASAAGAYVSMTATDITPLTDQPGMLGDWKNNLTCFAGDLGIILSACNVNNTSELSNVVNVPAAAPDVTTTAASALALTGASLNGTVSANGAATTVSFEYGLTTSYGSTLAAGSLLANASNAVVSTPLSGLTCNTTYHFRITANNGIGATTLGNDVSFSTLPCGVAAPTVITTAATALALTGASLNGTVSANGAATTVSFEYGLTASYGSTLAAGSLLANASNAAVSTALGGLTCATTYHFRITANNGTGGTIVGSDMSFSTLACGIAAPTVTTTAATAISLVGATLNGKVTSNGAPTTVSLDYGPTTAYGVTIALGTQADITINAPWNTPVSGLTCNTIYHFRITASNSAGTTLGNDLSFTTLPCAAAAPTVTTAAATALALTGATLNGTVSANGAATAVNFEYGPTTAYGLSLPAGSLLASASNAVVSTSLSGLTCASTYHFRITANNGTGNTILGSDVSFSTLPCGVAVPTVTTAAATAQAMTSVTLNGNVSANGAVTTVSFDYGLTSAYGSTLSVATLVANSSNSPIAASLAGLTCNITYHFRITANNSAGSTHGNDLSFSTLACAAAALTVTTTAASGLAMTAATLNGNVTANGAVTTVSFEYGLTNAYGTTQAAGLANANAINLPMIAPLSGLTCNTTYHFRIDANNGNGGTVFGNDLSFTTLACPVVTSFSGMTSTNSGTATAILSGGGATCSFGNAAFVAPSSPVPAGVNFPDGLFQFSTTNCTGAITITVTFPTAFQPAAQYWKYGPTPSQAAAHWYTLGAANALMMSGRIATFQITDGALGDDDLLVNGSIVDAGGPSAINPTAVVATPVPSLNQWGLLALCGLLIALAGKRMRTRAMNADQGK